MERLGFSGRLKPAKGYHFDDGPYVEFECSDELTAAEIASLPALLTDSLRQIVSENIATVVEMSMSKDEAQRVCSNMDLRHYPEVMRIIFVAGLACPCGGTHVRSTAEIGDTITVSKLKKKKNMLRVSYNL